MQEPSTVIVLGAGVTGLTAAHRLRTRLGADARIIVADPADRVGGKLRTVDSGAGPVEVGAEAYLAFREDATGFFESLGLGGELVTPSGLPSALYVDGALRAMPRNTVMGVPAAAEDLADLVSAGCAERIRAEAAVEEVAPMHWVPGDDCNLGQLVAARLGQEVADHVVSPLLGGVYSTLADDLGLRATVPQLAGALDDLARAGGPVTLTGAAKAVLDARRAKSEPRVASTAPAKPAPVFRTFAGGFRLLLDALVREAAAELRLGAAPGPVARVDGGYEVPGVGRADGVVLAAPAPATGRLLAGLAPDAAEIIAGVDLASSAVVALRFDTDAGLPANSGILVAADAGLDAKAFTFSSRKWPHLGARGGALIRASFGRFDDDSLVHEDDDRLVELALRDLRRVTGFTAEPVETLVQRWWGGLPRYGVGHTELMDVADAALADPALAGVAAAGAWHRGPGIPACLADGRRAADEVAEAVLARH
ncbi:protoporphyrinogen oxidase [Corynebacterium sphenisci]|uniref:protoporphyrinogen oxidase n=1 Tax=Corynebacterium sphenisci TaxID=191493 RepID=UPI0026DED521|nr:protoporphyrinogen oxidase [Corynebacterium sphenisci]MDO5731685.1 protoporphyrinogen oxidase [Corynebacterium sphenisci]